MLWQIIAVIFEYNVSISNPECFCGNWRVSENTLHPRIGNGARVQYSKANIKQLLLSQREREVSQRKYG